MLLNYKRIFVFFLILLTLFFLYSRKTINGSTKYIDPIYTVKTSTNIKYGSAVGYDGKTESLMLDIYEPNDEGAGNRPLIIFVHGGSFVGGTKGIYNENAINLAKKGYVVSSIDYRLDTTNHGAYTPASPDINKAINIAKEDTLAAVHWFVVNSSQYKIDTEKIFLGGSSAGAVTVLYASYGEETDAKRIKAVYSIAGTVLPDGLEIIDESDPPTIMFNGTVDTIVPYAMASATIDKLKSKGVIANLVTYQGSGHGIISQKNTDIHQKLTEFLYTYVNLPFSSPTPTQIMTLTPTITPGSGSPTPTITITPTPTGLINQTPTPTLTPTPSIIPEDLNNDGAVNMTDVEELIKNYLFGVAKADFNQDKVVNGFDFIKLYEKIGH